MSEEQSHESVEREHVQRSEHAESVGANGPGMVGELASQATPPYPVGLLGSSKLGERGNAPVRAALMQRIQQTYGNRAVQRYLQRRATTTTSQGSDEIAARIQSRSGSGNSLDTGVQRTLEQGLGADLSAVRVHTDGEADSMARSVGAVAFTTDSDIFFRQGAYNPTSSEGLRLLAHEATHTVQQAQGTVAGTPVAGGVSISDPSDPYEQAAEHTAHTFVSRGHSAEVSHPTQRTVQRQAPEEEEAISPVETTRASSFTQRMQASYGNRATRLYLQRIPGPDSGTTTLDAPSSSSTTSAPITGPTIVDIGAEKVEVSSDDEKREAERIIDDIKDKYGIDIASTSGIDAIKQQYTGAPDDVKGGLKSKEWKFKELKALERALSHFAAILGSKRSLSNRASDAQEITSASKVDQAISTNSASGVLDTTTLGEFFTKGKNFSMFTAGEDKSYDFSGDNAKQLEGTAVHEIAHGLMKYALSDYVKGLDYWTDEDTASGKANAEAPITNYGATNAREDLSEAVMFYFVEPDTLKKGKGKTKGTPGNPCPTRYELIDGFVSKWKPPVGDFPTPDPNVDTAIA